MVFPRGVDVLRLLRVVDQRGNRADKVPAVFKHIEHRPPVLAKLESLVQLHLARKPRVVPLAEDHPGKYVPDLLLHAHAPAPVPDRRVCDARDVQPLAELRLHQLRKPLRDLAGREHQPRVRLALHTAVKLLVSVRPPLLVNRPYAEGKRPRVSVVEAHRPRPVQRNSERPDHVRIQPVLVVLRIVGEFRERLPVKRVPSAQQQRLPERPGLLLQLKDVFPGDVRVVPDRRRDVFKPPHLRLTEDLAFNRLLFDERARVRALHKPLLHPRVSRSSGVARAAHAGHDAQRPVRPQPRSQIVVHRLREMRQLVKVQPVDLRALILEQSFAFVLQMAEVRCAPVDEAHLVRRGDVSAQLLWHDGKHRAHQRHLQLRVCPPEEIRVCPRVFHAPHERIPADGGALAASRRPAIEHLVRLALVKAALLVRRLILKPDLRHPPPPSRPASPALASLQTQCGSPCPSPPPR